MKRLKFLVSLTNDDNDYQQEQSAAAEKAGRRLGVDVKIIHAGNDALAQSQQLLHHVQDASSRPDAIMFEPAGGTAFPQVARAAAAAGIGWAVLNHDADYVQELRRTFNVPVLSITSDHQEVGKIQGQQFGALLPNGGNILYIEGPANSSAAKERTVGMNLTKPANIQVKMMRANWTEESAYKTVSSAAPEHFAGKPHRPGRSAGRQHGDGRAKGFQRDRRGFTGALDEDSDYRLRWHAQNWAGVGAKRHVGGDNFYSAEY